MRKVDPSKIRRDTPEISSFEGTEMPDAPPEINRTGVRTPVRTRVEGKRIFEIPVPGKNKRSIIRHAFQIFEDQLAALKIIQMADLNQKGSKLTFADITREALDDYIAKRVGQEENLMITTEQ